MRLPRNDSTPQARGIDGADGPGVLCRIAGVARALAGRGGEPPRERIAYALLSAERLCAMLAYVRAAEALVSHAPASPRHRRWAERFVHRSLPLVRMHGAIVRSGDRSRLEAC